MAPELSEQSMELCKDGKPHDMFFVWFANYQSEYRCKNCDHKETVEEVSL